jgi:hypothetical protein
LLRLKLLRAGASCRTSSVSTTRKSKILLSRDGHMPRASGVAGSDYYLSTNFAQKIGIRIIRAITITTNYRTSFTGRRLLSVYPPHN